MTSFMITACFIMLLSADLEAQFNISGEFRPRLEYRDGYGQLRSSKQSPYVDILGRNRILFDYKNDKFQAKFSFQHAYVFGENNYASDTITRNTINIHEGWFKYNFTPVFAFKIGRTELIYDDARLFGNSNWAARGASHDVVLAQWESSKISYRGDFGFAINNTAPANAFLSTYQLKNYKYMGYLYQQKKFLKENLIFSILAVTDIFQQPGKDRYDTLFVINANHDTIGTTVIKNGTTNTDSTQLYGRLTIGGTATFIWKNLKVFGAGYYQTGHFSDGRTLSAGMFGGYASYKIVKPLTLLAGYEWISGNDYSDTKGIKTKSTSFSTLYGTSHGFYGYMDLFTRHVVGGNSSGLTDLYARATLALSSKTSLEATYRMFGLAKGYLPIKTSTSTFEKVDKNLGSELDLMVLYKPYPNFEINAAYCFYLPTTTMEKLNKLAPNTSTWAQFAYIMLTYKPNFFNSDKH